MANSKTLIIYFSRTGRTRRLALRLAQLLDADIEEIECRRYRLGLFGWWRFLRAGFNSIKGNLPRIGQLRHTPADYDLVVLGTPIWTSYPCLPMRALLDARPDMPGRIAGFLTYGGQSEPDKAFDMMAEMLGQPIKHRLAIMTEDGKLPDMDAKAARFADILESEA
ncbi:hypothetical protein BN1012_Phect1435 [Candidatus Phaeomarinobacter ectocarpi]|uniref:Flavodoxin-like domain-containing protein n=1 Tax=Candidatus Phaeomarinibacter ectocarpi TaxID=1458461 RepID=X5MF74_9HYPH|nr:hypothetical protein [Candidatus Phaeomarinobacter ectocarpi]CDO59649.1 hypothetical protein BN1012_Phect1435 [Candidatus Phaeomarinobacter ectocarpi]